MNVSLPLTPPLSPSVACSLGVGKRRYNIRLWKTFTDCFNCLPVAAILDEKIFCCHGGKGRGSGMQVVLPCIGQHRFWHLHICLCFLALGLSPDLQSMEQIRRIMRPTDVPDQGMCRLTDAVR